MNRKKTWLIAAGAGVGIWAIALGTLALLQAAVVTPEKVVTFIQSQPLAEMSPTRRREHVEQLARKVNQLSMDQRENAAYRDAVRQHFQTMTRQERARFIDLTVSTMFKHLFQRINEMSREQRQKFVSRTVEQMKKQNPRQAEQDLERAKQEIGGDAVQRIVDEGFRSLMSEASAEAKLDLAPLIEQMQRQIERTRGR